MRQQQAQQAFKRRSQVVTAHDIHHYYRRLKGALAALDQWKQLFRRTGRQFERSSNFILLKD